MIILFLILGAIGLTAAVLIAVSLLREEGIEIWQPPCPCDCNFPFVRDPIIKGKAWQNTEGFRAGYDGFLGTKNADD